MESWLASSPYPVRSEVRRGRGRCLVATRPLPAGTLVLAASLPAVHVMAPEVRCAFCAAPPAEGALLSCAGCKRTRYCSPACQRADWPNHRAECKHVGGWMAALSLPDRITLLLLGRLQRGKGGGMRREGEPAASGAPGGVPVYVHTRGDVLGMVADVRGRLDAHFTRLLALAHEHGFLEARREEEEEEEEEESGGSGGGAAAGPGLGPLSAEGELRVLNTFDANNFGVTDELLTLRASAVAPLAALLNHACRPNCVLGFACAAELEAEAAGGAPAPLDALPPPARARHILTFRTLHGVGEGEELTHAYVEQMMLAEARREYLQRAYGFHCACPACEAADEAWSAGAGGGGGGGGFSHERVMLAGATRAASAGGPLRVGIVRAAPAGEGQGEEEDVTSEFEGMPAEAAADVKAAQGILTAVALAVGKPEVLDGLGRTVAAAREEDAYILRRARAARGLPPEAGRALLREVRALEAAAALLRRHLHPLHAQVQACANMLSERYMSVADDRGAAACNEHVVAFYRHVYAGLAGRDSSAGGGGGDGGVHHPMLSLQLFTLGDLYTALADATMEAYAGGGGGQQGQPPPCSEARAAELRALFVEYDAAGEPDFVGARVRPVALPAAPAASPQAGVAAVRAWLTRAGECYREAAAGLRITHGATHALAVDAAERAAAAEAQLAGGRL
jgi:hypothetical protein